MPRTLLSTLAALLCLFTCAPAPAQEAATVGSPSLRPNILWISCEDISPDLGCYGDCEARTPNLDRLASQGTRFSNAFVFAPVCAPSRSTIITGMYATSIGTMHMRSKGVPPHFVKCFPEYLRAAGYYCTNNSKTDYNFDSPVTAWDESSKNAHWRNRPKNAPFFSVFNLTVTHESKFHMNDKQLLDVTPHISPAERHDPSRAKLPPYYPDTPAVRKDWARYYDMISEMDYQAGEILGELEADGLAGDTIVFFFSDHGRALPRGKRWVYDSGLRVPLLVRWPQKLSPPQKMKPASVNDDLVSFVDLAPTVLTLAGISPPAHMQGQAFLGPNAPAPRSYVFGMRNRMDEVGDTIRCVRDKRFKYIRNLEPQKPYAQPIAYGEKTPTMQEMRRLHADGKLTGPQTLFFRPTKPAEELYDLAADPHEVNDLAAAPEYQQLLVRMRRTLDEWTTSTRDLGLMSEEELKERMRPGGRWEQTSAPLFVRAPGSPRRVELSCPTQGASIAYRIGGSTPAESASKNPGRKARRRAARRSANASGQADGRGQWKLYTKPFTVTGGTTVTAKACRLGFTDSPEVQAGF